MALFVESEKNVKKNDNPSRTFIGCPADCLLTSVIIRVSTHEKPMIYRWATHFDLKERTWRVASSSKRRDQAYWIYRGHAQQVQTAMVPITAEQVALGWQEIRRQEEMQRQLLDAEDVRPDAQQVQKQANTAADERKSQ
jgi:hypothetical protein